MQLDDFVATTATREALDLARVFAAPKTAAALLYGPSGVGKSHLVRTILRLAATRGARSVAYLTAAQLIEQFLAATRTGLALPFRPNIPASGTLAIDDLHVLAGKPITQREIGRLLRELLSEGVSIVCAATCERREIQALRDLLRELPALRLTALRRPSSREMRRVVSALARRQSLTLSESALAAIVDRSAGDVRRALGALNGARFERQLYQ